MDLDDKALYRSIEHQLLRIWLDKKYKVKYNCHKDQLACFVNLRSDLMAAMHARNPYVAGNPVGDSPAFVGRADVLRAVLRVLRHQQQNAIVLYGQRRIGKTSILQQLAAQLPKEGAYCPVYFDLQDKAAWPLGPVLLALARTVAHTLDLPEPDLSTEPETSFRDRWLPATLESLPPACSLVLLLDEFDVLADARAEQAAATFFPYLRELLISAPGQLQFVFVIGRNVDDLATIALSLFKGTPSMRVSLLNRRDTMRLVRLSENNGTLNWSDKALERVWQLTDGHPFLTQQLCSHVWEGAYDVEPSTPPLVTPVDVDAAVPEALDTSRNMLEWLWDGLPSAERVVASALAAAGSSPISQAELENVLHESGVSLVIHELQNAPQLLQEWGLIKSTDYAYHFRVELLRRWIHNHKPLHRVQAELDRIEPTADSLYRAAVGLYRKRSLDQAVASLRQAIRINANHVGATLLLADILLAQGQVLEAQRSLEELYKYAPSAARPLLVKTLMAEAMTTRSKVRQLHLYAKVLKIDPEEPRATVNYSALVEALLEQARKSVNDAERVQLYEPILDNQPEQEEASDQYQAILERNGYLYRKISKGWNPLNHLRLLLWITTRADLFWLYWHWADTAARKRLRQISRWLFSILILLPILSITVAMGIDGALPMSQALSPNSYLWMSAGLMVSWLLNGWFGGRSFGVMLALASVTAYFVGTNMMLDLSGSMVLILFFSLTFSLVTGIAFGAATSLAETIYDSQTRWHSIWAPPVPGSWPEAAFPGASLEPYLTGGVTGVMAGFLIASRASRLGGLVAGVLVFLVSFGVVFALAVSVGESLKVGRPSRLVFMGFLLSVLSCLFLIWFSLLDGWRILSSS